MFSKKTLQIAHGSSVPLYHKTFKIPFDQVFRVIARHTVSIPAGHSMIVPDCIPDWKRSPVELVGSFEPHQKFNGKDLTAPDMLFTLTEDTIPLVIENSGDSPITVHKHTTLGSSEVISRERIQNIGTAQTGFANDTKMTDMVDEKYDLNLVKGSIDHELYAPIKSQFSALIDELSDVFSKNEGDIGKCDVTSHKIDVYPGSRPIKLPNRRMPLHLKQDLRKKSTLS